MRRCVWLLLPAAWADPGVAQEAVPPTSPGDLPFEVRHVLRVANSIIGTPGAGVSLEAFRNDTVTGVYLLGSFEGKDGSVGFGRGTEGLRYLWFSTGGSPGIEYIGLLYDLDHDLSAEFMLLRTIDRNLRTDYAVEYRAPSVRSVEFDITLQPACGPPRCDPASWTERPRQVVLVPAGWFDPWRPLISLAVVRGERWLGQPVGVLQGPKRAESQRRP